MSFRGRVARVLRTVANGKRSVTIGAELPEWYGSRLYSSIMLWAKGGPKYGFLAENDQGTGLLLGQGTDGQPARATLTVWPDSVSLAGPKGADPERALLTTGYTSAVDGIGEAGSTELGSFWVTTKELTGTPHTNPQELTIKGNPLKIYAPVTIIDGTRSVTLSDSGWIDIPTLPGFSGDLKYRRLNNAVEVLANVTGTFPMAPSITDITLSGAIPSALRPQIMFATAAGVGSNNASVCSFRVLNDGKVQFVIHAGPASSFARARTNWTI